MTLGEWLNRVILEDETAAAASPDPEPEPEPQPPPRLIAEPPRPRPSLQAVPRSDDLTRIAVALDRLTDRLEASETRTGLAISGVEHTVRQAVARIDAAERETLAVATRCESAVDRVGGEQARLLERLRRMETEASGPRSTEALRAIEQSVTRVAAQVYDVDSRLARSEARAIPDAAVVADEVVRQLGERLAQAEQQTGQALETLRRSLGALDGRLRLQEHAPEAQERRFEALGEALQVELEAARTQISERLTQVDAGRIDRRFAQISADVEAAEARSARAIQEIGRHVLSMAERLKAEVQDSETRQAGAIARVGDEMARVAGAMEVRIGRAEQTQSEAMERLSSELGRITDKLSDRLLVSERRAAEAIDDVGSQVSRVTERMAESQERATQDIADRIQQSEERTAQLLAETCERLEQRLGEARPTAPAEEPPAAPSQAAFGPALFSRAEDDLDELDELDLAVPAPQAVAEAAPIAPEPLAQAAPEPARPDAFAADAFAPPPPLPAAKPARSFAPPRLDPEEDLFDLEQPEPPPVEANPALSTREVIEQARAAARAAAPLETGPRPGARSRTWASGAFFGIRPRRAPGGSTLQTALMVAGGAAFLSVGAAGVVLMQGPESRPAAEAVAPPRAAVALAPQSLDAAPEAGSAPLSDPTSPRPPAQLADALTTAYDSAVRDIEAGQSDALPRLKAIAEAGHPASQFYLGKLYETGGHGVVQNLAEARRWTEKAAAGGDPAAMHNLALFAFRGDGGPQDLKTAARWFHAAAERGVVDSQYNLGLLYQSGSGVDRDLAQAYAWFAIAATGGDIQAKANAKSLKPKLSAPQAAAAEQLIAAYARPAGAAASASAAPARPAADSAAVAQAQRTLGRLGYFAGAADGADNPAFKSALAAYQRDHRLAATGELDPTTAGRLAVFAR